MEVAMTLKLWMLIPTATTILCIAGFIWFNTDGWTVDSGSLYFMFWVWCATTLPALAVGYLK